MAVSGSAGLECRLRTCISNKLPGEAEAEVDQGPPLGNHYTEGVSWELFISPSGSQPGCTLESPGSFPKCTCAATILDQMNQISGSGTWALVA